MRSVWLSAACLFAVACSDNEMQTADSGVGADAGTVIPNPDAATFPDASTSGDRGMTSGDAAEGEDLVPLEDAAVHPDATTPPEDGGGLPNSTGPAVTRGGMYEGFPERFNRRYTDPSYQPQAVLYVSPAGGGDGNTRSTPTNAIDAVNRLAPGTQIVFLDGDYQDFCIDLDQQSGTYDDPIILSGDTKLGATLHCCDRGRRTCINLEASDYVAVENLKLQGGRYGVRAVGADFDASDHQVGVSVTGCEGFEQNNDPFFTGQSDWAVFESNIAHHAGAGDGHGIYLSNGSDFNIVRFNELYENASSDFQINADPNFTCNDVNTSDCDAWAGTGEGGRGASDYMLIEGNFFHHGNAQGANFTSVRRSRVVNNIFAFYARHGVSFWQETPNPNLGSRENFVHHNLFITTNNRQALQFIEYSTANDVRNNVLIGLEPGVTLMELDGTVGANVYENNFEAVGAAFDPAWFTNFPMALTRDARDLAPSATAPFLDSGALLDDARFDLDRSPRTAPTDSGPFERR